MDRTDEIFSSSGSLANSYLADALRGAGASLEEFVTANASFAVIVFVALFFVLVIVALILHGVAPTRIGEKKDTDGVTEKNDESESPHGTLECFDVTGSVLKTIRVFAYEPDWDYDEDAGGLITYVSSERGDEGEIDIGPREYAVYRSDEPDGDGDAGSEWRVVIIDPSGSVLFKEIVRDEGRPDDSDNGICSWDREGRQLSIYCGSALAVAVVPHLAEVLGNNKTAST